jgi:hypothetical protein
VLWAGAGPRRARGQDQPMGRAGPAGTRGITCGDEPRSPFPLEMGSMPLHLCLPWPPTLAPVARHHPPYAAHRLRRVTTPPVGRQGPPRVGSAGGALDM